MMVKTTEVSLNEYMESTLNDVKTIINVMGGSEDDKKHLLDRIWMLVYYDKGSCDCTVDSGFCPESVIPKHATEEEIENAYFTVNQEG